MPRPNQPRSIVSESALARRIASEREARGMSYEALAIQMKHVGCPMNASALFRIEKGDPPRRITVAEWLAFAQVFGVPVEQMLLPPEIAAAEELAELVINWNAAQDKAFSAKQEEDEAWERVRAWVEEHPEHREKVGALLRKWSETYFEDDDLGHDFRAAHKMWELTKDAEWGERAKESLDALVAQRRGGK